MSRQSFLRLPQLLLGAALAVVPSLGLAEPVAEPSGRPAAILPNALTAAVFDVERAGDRLVSVGERGIILLSDDNGASWRQVPVPVAITLTAVQFVDAKTGWAVGHAGTVLHTTDGGESWVRQFDGVTAAKLAHEEAAADAAAAPNDKNMQAMLKNAEYLVSDGPDKPFLDLQFKDAQNGYIVGAYGLFFKTSDGGQTWQSWLEHVPNYGARHLTAIEAKGNDVYLAGEQGLFARSHDGGNNFEMVPTPYRGAYFDVSLLPSGEIVLFGLRGNAFWTANDGASFTQVKVPIPASLFSSAMTSDGTIYATNQAGMLMMSKDHGRSLFPAPIVSRGVPLTQVVEAADGSLVAASFGGPFRVTFEQSQKVGE